MFCDQCDQGTHKFDFQSPLGMPRRLPWKNKRGSGKSLQLYKGVCYKCFDTRRAYFKAYSQKELKDARKGNKALDDEFWSRRALKYSRKFGNTCSTSKWTGTLTGSASTPRQPLDLFACLFAGSFDC